MRSLLYLMSLLTLIAGSGGAQGRREGPMAGEPKGIDRMMMPGLTDEQRTKIEGSRVGFMKEIEPLRADIQKKESALRLEQTSDKMNEANVKSILSEIARLQTDLAGKHIAHQRAVRDLLTTDQRTQFDARILQAGRGSGRGMIVGRGGRPGRGPGGMRGSCDGRCVNTQ